MSNAEYEDALFESKFRAENKDIFVDVKKNDNGVYLKISERNRNNRSTILIPASGIESLRDALNAALDAIPSTSSGAKAIKASTATVASDNKGKTLEEKKVFVTSLSWDVSSKELQDFFCSQIGSANVVSAEILIRRDGRSIGSGVVEFTTAEATKTAIRIANGKNLNGRDIVVREYYAEK